MQMNRETFRSLPREHIARLLQLHRTHVAAIAVNGTRRWFVMEFGKVPEKYPNQYLDAMSHTQIRLCKLFYSLGLKTLVMPVFGLELVGRGSSYRALAAAGINHLATDPALLEYYRTAGICVRCYGDYKAYFQDTPYAYLIGLLDLLAQETAGNGPHRLFLGICADDATETVARLAVDYAQKHGQAPDKRTLVELYYGEYVEPIKMFIGFDQFCMVDVPLLTTGAEDLYYTVAPSPYLNEMQLRDILYDHLFARRSSPDTASLEGLDVQAMRRFYAANRHRTQGLGVRYGGVWFPLPDVQAVDFAQPAEDAVPGIEPLQRLDAGII
jgi:hypothetical protein